MSEESAVLEWKNYTHTESEAFQKRYENVNFTDVTLACEDNQKVEAHKVILSMWSNLFSKILKSNPNHHPLIYLQGVIIEDLILLKRFMYLGKETVLKKQLDSFMNVSKLFLNSNKETNNTYTIKPVVELQNTIKKEQLIEK